MKINVVGPVIRNAPFGTEIAFVKGLRHIGHQVKEFDPSCPDRTNYWDVVDFTLIFKTAYPYNRAIQEVSGPKIVYQPDDLRFPHIQQLMKEMRQYADYALTFDDDGARELVKPEYGYKKAQTLLLTADDDLYRPLNVERDLDFVFVGSLGGSQSHASRRKMIQILLAAGYRVHFEETYDTNRIVELYNRAKVVLNHATDVGQKFGTGYGFQCRHFEVGMTKTCLLSNSNTSVGPVGWFSFNDERTLLSAADYLINNEAARIMCAEELYSDICNHHMPWHRARAVVDFVRSL